MANIKLRVLHFDCNTLLFCVLLTQLVHLCANKPVHKLCLNYIHICLLGIHDYSHSLTQ